MSDEPRHEILSAIRGAIGAPHADRAGAWARIPRAYRSSGALDAKEHLALFTERLHDYDAEAHLCPPADIAETIGRCLETAGHSHLLLPPDFPQHWLPSNARFTRDGGLAHDEIDRSDGVITACAAAIAITGTIVLREGGFAQGRRALTLIPDYHLCIVEQRQIVETVPEGLRILESAGTPAITTISGPSATADIEMIRVRGVHGPRTLEVIVVISQDI